MTDATETYLVAEGVSTLDGKPVKKGQRVQMAKSAALYHLSLARLERSSASKKASSGSKAEPQPVTAVSKNEHSSAG